MADTPALIIENIYKRFGELEVLKGVSLTAYNGDVISIIGSSGSRPNCRRSARSCRRR